MYLRKLTITLIALSLISLLPVKAVKAEQCTIYADVENLLADPSPELEFDGITSNHNNDEVVKKFIKWIGKLLRDKEVTADGRIKSSEEGGPCVKFRALISGVSVQKRVVQIAGGGTGAVTDSGYEDVDLASATGFIAKIIGQKNKMIKRAEKAGYKDEHGEVNEKALYDNKDTSREDLAKGILGLNGLNPGDILPDCTTTKTLTGNFSYDYELHSFKTNAHKTADPQQPYLKLIARLSFTASIDIRGCCPDEIAAACGCEHQLDASDKELAMNERHNLDITDKEVNIEGVPPADTPIVYLVGQKNDIQALISFLGKHVVGYSAFVNTPALVALNPATPNDPVGLIKQPIAAETGGITPAILGAAMWNQGLEKGFAFQPVDPSSSTGNRYCLVYPGQVASDSAGFFSIKNAYAGDINLGGDLKCMDVYSSPINTNFSEEYSIQGRAPAGNGFTVGYLGADDVVISANVGGDTPANRRGKQFVPESVSYGYKGQSTEYMAFSAVGFPVDGEERTNSFGYTMYLLNARISLTDDTGKKVPTQVGGRTTGISLRAKMSDDPYYYVVGYNPTMHEGLKFRLGLFNTEKDSNYDTSGVADVTLHYAFGQDIFGDTKFAVDPVIEKSKVPSLGQSTVSTGYKYYMDNKGSFSMGLGPDQYHQEGTAREHHADSNSLGYYAAFPIVNEEFLTQPIELGLRFMHRDPATGEISQFYVGSYIVGSTNMGWWRPMNSNWTQAPDPLKVDFKDVNGSKSALPDSYRRATMYWLGPGLKIEF